MPTDWAAKVRDAITNLEIDTGRVLEPAKALAIIDDVVAGKFAAAELATIHGIPQEVDQDDARADHQGGWHGPCPVARGRRLVRLPGA
jgi:hypothetical protein